MHQLHCSWQILKDIFLYSDLGNLSPKDSDLVHRIIITDVKCINDQGKVACEQVFGRAGTPPFPFPFLAIIFLKQRACSQAKGKPNSFFLKI